MSATTTADPPVLAARTAVAVVFGLNGLLLASWFARVPAARDALGLSAGQLGLLLLTLSSGALLALPTAGAVAHRLGAPRTVVAATSLAAVGMALVGVAGGSWRRSRRSGPYKSGQISPTTPRSAGRFG